MTKDLKYYVDPNGILFLTLFNRDEQQSAKRTLPRIGWNIQISEESLVSVHNSSLGNIKLYSSSKERSVVIAKKN